MLTTSSPLFDNISTESLQAMRVCFGVVDKTFRPDEVIYDFDHRRDMVGVITSGSAYVERIDFEGGRTILEHLHEGGVFGEMLMFENVAGDTLRVICEKACKVSFLPAGQLTKRCENACTHHSVLVENMFRLVTEKATGLSERVEVLSRRSIRDKLMCYFAQQAAHQGSDTFQMPFSLSTLADYISADRSAMMRELKKMREGDHAAVAMDGRKVTLLHNIRS